jgi:hypothetical protein
MSALAIAWVSLLGAAPAPVRIHMQWFNHLSASDGSTLIVGDLGGAKVFTTTRTLVTHRAGQATAGTLDAKAIAALFKKLDGLAWAKLGKTGMCGVDASLYELEISRGSQTNRLSIDSACRDRHNAVRAAIEDAVAHATPLTLPRTVEHEPEADAGRGSNLRLWPSAVTRANGELCRWNPGAWSCLPDAGALPGEGDLSQVGETWLWGDAFGRVEPEVLQAVWW